VSWNFGSEAANTNTTAWLDDFYTHQFTANIPVVTAGAEQLAPPGGITPVGGGLVGGGLVHGGLTL
jgi:hypothetical protein